MLETIGCALLASASLVAASEPPADSVVVRPGGTLRLHTLDDHLTEAAWDGGALDVVGGEVELPQTEGDHWLAMASRAPSGLLSEVTWTRVRVDATPPTIDFVPPPGHREANQVIWLAPRTPVTVRVEDELAGARDLTVRSADGTDLGGVVETDVVGGLQTQLATSDRHGPLNWRAAASDRVGNLSEAQSDLLWVDARPPQGEFRVEGPSVDRDGLWIVGPATSIEPHFEDGDSGLEEVRVEVDGDPGGGRVENPRLRCCSDLAEGLHQLVAIARDAVGNEERLRQPLRVDATAPQPRLEVRSERSILTEAGEIHRAPAEVTVVASDEIAGLASLSWSGSADPNRGAVVSSSTTFTVQVADRVDNTASLDLRVEVDGEGPALLLRGTASGEAPPEGTLRVMSGESLSVIGEDAGAGVERIEVSRRYRNWYRDERYRLRERFHFTTPGEYRVYARARDRLGNESRARWNVIVETR